MVTAALRTAGLIAPCLKTDSGRFARSLKKRPGKRRRGPCRAKGRKHAGNGVRGSGAAVVVPLPSLSEDQPGRHFL